MEIAGIKIDPSVYKKWDLTKKFEIWEKTDLPKKVKNSALSKGVGRIVRFDIGVRGLGTKDSDDLLMVINKTACECLHYARLSLELEGEKCVFENQVSLDPGCTITNKEAIDELEGCLVED